MPLHVPGNICLALAALVYLFPLRILVRDMSRKRDDGGGAIAGALIMLVLWALLLAGLLLTVAAGGFDWLPLSRAWLYPAIVASALSLVAVTFVSLTGLHRPSWSKRLLWGWPLYLIPWLTMALVALSLNRSLGATVPPELYRWPWAALASLSLLGCAGYCGYLGTRWAGRKFSGFRHLAGIDAELERKHLPIVAALDPEQSFEDLLGFANMFQPAPVRELASARLRTHPRFVDTMNEVLRAGSAKRGLEFLECTELTAEEARQFADAALQAMLRFVEELPADLRHAPPARRKATHRWAGHAFRTIAAKLKDGGIDFAPAFEQLEAVFDGRAER